MADISRHEVMGGFEIGGEQLGPVFRLEEFDQTTQFALSSFRLVFCL